MHKCFLECLQKSFRLLSKHPARIRPAVQTMTKQSVKRKVANHQAACNLRLARALIARTPVVEIEIGQCECGSETK